MSRNVAKLSLDQFLRLEAFSNRVRLLLPEQAEPVDRNGNGLSSFVTVLQDHSGMYEINGITYDSVVFTGSDNIYFSYEFNPNSRRAIVETLFILSSLQISKTSDNTYCTTHGFQLYRSLTIFF